MGDDSAMLRQYLVARKRALGQEIAEVNRLLAQLDGKPQNTRAARPARAQRSAPTRPAPNISGHK